MSHVIIFFVLIAVNAGFIRAILNPQVDPGARGQNGFEENGKEFVDEFIFDAELQDHLNAVRRAEQIATKKILRELDEESAAALKNRENGEEPYRFIAKFSGSTQYAKAMSLPYMKVIEILKEIKRSNRLSKSEMNRWLNQMGQILAYNSTQVDSDDEDNGSNASPDVCPFNPNIQCNFVSKYRTYDGSCNNMKHPLWGRANTPFLRWLDSDYADDLELPRVSRDRTQLPSARLVSRSIHKDKDRPSAVHTIALMTFGQLLDHDVDKTAQSKLMDNSDPNQPKLVDINCGDDNCDQDEFAMRECFSIPVPDNDSCFKKTKCLKVVRSQPVPDLECGKNGNFARQQLNQITAYLDASFNYGSSKREALSLRAEMGKLRLNRNPLHHGMMELLPTTDNPACKEPFVNETVKCVTAGDGRVNEWIGLATFHTIFAREHNRIVEQLEKINPSWTDEKLYKEARRILIAVWQRITYKEYLPIVLGEEFENYDLKLRSAHRKYYTGYDENVNAQPANVFQGAAFRFGHSQIDAFIRFISDNKFHYYHDEHLTSHQNRPSAMYEDGDKGGIDTILRGHVHLPSQNTDAFFTKQMSCHMFTSNPPFGEGTDLPAINIQRGRDHGLPGYNEWRRFCGLSKIRSWNQKPREFSKTVWNSFKKVYKHVDDIDIFTGGISETRVAYGAVGPTFACLLGKQFENLRKGDRYWHENMGPGMFTPDQLHSLETSSTLSRIICDNSDEIQYIQPNVLLLPYSEIPFRTRMTKYLRKEFKYLYGVSKSKSSSKKSGFINRNERVRCSEIRKLDLTPWKEL